MLSLDSHVSQESWVCDHCHVVICGHFVPSLQTDFGVVDGQGWGNDTAEAVPVLRDVKSLDYWIYERCKLYLSIIAVGPVENKLREDQVVC
jgi:hypothetical protein